jgi:hypothetical protein
LGNLLRNAIAFLITEPKIGMHLILMFQSVKLENLCYP